MVSLSTIITIWLSLLICFLNTRKDQQLFIIHGFAQGTDYTISYYDHSAKVNQENIDSVLLKIDSSMSLYKSYSLINKFNASKDGLQLDHHFTKVIKKSFQIYKDTNGLFDITVAPLVQLWGFGPVPVKKFPDSLLIQQTLKNVGMNLLEFNGAKLFKSNPLVNIDVNGIAQGYSVDEVARYLDRLKIKSYIVEIGGELYVKGRKPDGTGFRIGIEGPAPDNKIATLFRHVISIKNGAITTSGNYTKYLHSKSKKVSHLIDSKTGYPLNNQMISVTLYARDAITADGYDNALMAMGVNEALNFIAVRNGMEAYLIYRNKDGSIADTLTKGFKKLIVN